MLKGSADLKKVYSIVLMFLLLLIFNGAANSETKNLNYAKNGVDENGIVIKTLGYELKGDTYEIDLACETPEDMGYAFFNPPEGDKIMVCDLQGLKKGANVIRLKFSKKDYDGLSEKILTFIFKSRTGKDIYFTTSIGDGSRSSSGELANLPAYDEKSENPWQIDLRGADVSKLDVTGRFNDLIHSNFDTETKWPSKLPEKFDPAGIMQLGRAPGLKIKLLHEKGIAGEGVSIGVIDQALLREHDEYADRIKHYEEMKCSDSPQMHSSAVVSLAAGKTVGTAPQSNIFYVATTFGTSDGDKKFNMNFKPLADAINKLLDINLKLSKPEKIRVISISVGWPKGSIGYDEVMKAVERAKKDGVFIISTCLDETYGFEFYGLGRMPLSDPEDVNSYLPGKFWSANFYKHPESFSNPMLLVPMDARTYAGPSHKSQYSFNPEGGLSWSVPYLAGVYALMCQVKSELTPEMFWEASLETGREII